MPLACQVSHLIEYMEAVIILYLISRKRWTLRKLHDFAEQTVIFLQKILYRESRCVINSIFCLRLLASQNKFSIFFIFYFQEIEDYIQK